MTGGTKKIPITFSIFLGVFFIAVIIAYGIVSQYYQEYATVTINSVTYSSENTLKGIQNVCCLIMDTVFTLLGFGLLLSPFRNQKWSGMALALFVVAFNIILGLLFQDMWFEIFFGFRKNLDNSTSGQYNAPQAFQFWNRHATYFKSTPSFYSFRLSNLCSTSYLVGMTAFNGRVSLNKLAISMPLFCLLFYLNYYLNALVCYSTQNKSISFAYLDAYGTILVYLFGGVYGIIVGAITKVPRQLDNQLIRENKSRASLHLSLLGSLFIFATFILSYTGLLTGLNTAVQNFRYNSAALLVMFGLIGGILGNFVASLLIGKGTMNVESIIMGTISGGIMVGGLADVIQNIGACLFIGFIAGAIAGAFGNIVSPKINQNSIIDSQGMLGPILVVAFIASFVIHPSVLSQFHIRNTTLIPRGLGYTEQDYRPARYHLAYLGLTLAFSAITGAILGGIYKSKTRQNHFEDIKFFAQDYGLFSVDHLTTIPPGQPMPVPMYSAGNMMMPPNQYPSTTMNQFDI